jgi:hypothetical protein
MGELSNVGISDVIFKNYKVKNFNVDRSEGGRAGLKKLQPVHGEWVLPGEKGAFFIEGRGSP